MADVKKTPQRRVVLIGAGHAHMLVAQQAKRFADAGVQLTLIDPGLFWYAGLATGVLGGQHDREDNVIHPQRLIEACGGVFVQDHAAAIDASLQQLNLASGRSLSYDALSINIGSTINITDVQGAAEHALPAKPVANLWRLRQRLEDCFRVNPSRPVRLIVIGAGATGCEIAANIDALARRHLAAADVTLISNSPRILPRHTRFAARRAADMLKARGIRIFTDTRAKCVTPTYVDTHDNRRIPCDLAIAATGLRPSPAIAKLGLGATKQGGLPINETLQVKDRHNVFAVGDCADFVDGPLPRLGSTAIHQAPTLADNLLASVTGGELGSYQPKRTSLVVLNLADDQAIAMWGPLHWSGRAAMQLKRRMDRRNLTRLRRTV